MRSDDIKNPSKTFFNATGRISEELDRPYIGIASTWTEHFPGHSHLNIIADAVSKGVYIGGGTPCIFGTIAVADCTIGSGKYPNMSLPSRDLIADSVECMAYASKFDALVLIAGCDKIIPGMLIAAARLDIPTIVVTGGPMLPGRYKGYSVDLTSGKFLQDEADSGRLTQDDVDNIWKYMCPGIGSCAGLFTANSMACITEILGMGLPGNGTIPAVDAGRIRLAKSAGIKIVELFNKNIKPSDILTREAFENAITIDMMMGGSTNTILHLLAIAHEMGVSVAMDDFAEISKTTPVISKITPSGKHYMVDLYEAGGIQAMMKQAYEHGMIYGDELTVTGDTIKENFKDAEVLDPNVIRPMDEAYSQTGGLNVLYGNLAPEGSVVKSSAVPENMLIFEGTANCYDSELDARAGLNKGEIKPGQVVVVRNEGPKGAPGMPEMVTLILEIQAAGMGDSVAFVTDGRFSGMTSGPCIGYICPEATLGGPIALVEDGDIISYDINEGTITLHVDDETLEKRRSMWVQPEPKYKTGYLAKYISMVGPSSEGAIVSGNADY